MDDGADPNPATGPPPGRGIYLHAFGGRTGTGPEIFIDPATGQQFRSYRDFLRGIELGLGRRRPGPSGTRSAAASPSDHPGAQGAATGPRIRQSALYSNRPRSLRRRQGLASAEEHPSEATSSELGRSVSDLPTFEALSLSEPPFLTPQITEGTVDDDAHPGAEGAVTGTRVRVRQSILYSNRPRRPRRRREPAPTEECPASEVSGSEFGSAVADLPIFEVLSLSEPPFVTPQTIDETEITDDDDAADDDYVPGDVEQIDPYWIRPKGISRSMVLSLMDSQFITVPTKKQPRPDSDEEDPEELQRSIDEYLDAHPCGSLREAFDSIIAVERATLAALAAKRGTEPRVHSALVAEPPMEPFPVDQDSMASGKPRREASMEAILADGKTWMREEVMLCFEKYIETRADLTGLVYYLDELRHQCFNVESYNKVFHHYNFTVKTKMSPSSIDWIVGLYFAEVMEIFGRKHYYCCPLEPDESGNCYACKGQGVDDLRHPAMGGFEMGSPDAPSLSLWYADE